MYPSVRPSFDHATATGHIKKNITGQKVVTICMSNVTPALLLKNVSDPITQKIMFARMAAGPWGVH